MQLTLSPDFAVAVLRYVLRRYRILAERSQEEAAARLGLKQPSIAGFEAGRPPSPPQLDTLLDFYGRRSQIERMRAVREVAVKQKNRADAVQIGLLDDMELRLGLEFFAASAEVYAPRVVHGLMQTPRYAKWIIENTLRIPGQSVDESLQLRMTRQNVLHRGQDADDLPPLRLQMFIEEYGLRRMIGGDDAPAVMDEQWGYLLEQAQLPNIDIRVIREGVFHQASTHGAASVLVFEDDLRVLFTEDTQASHFYDSAGALDNAGRMMTTLDTVALDHEQSVRLISTIRKEAGSA